LGHSRRTHPSKISFQSAEQHLELRPLASLLLHPTSIGSRFPRRASDLHQPGHASELQMKDDHTSNERNLFDPLNLYADTGDQAKQETALPILGGMFAMLGGSAAAEAGNDIFNLPALDPATFQPVCSASDSFYRVAQALVISAVGQENYKEFAPLVAQGLLRVRLELCVLESFVYEAILPFIKEKGLSWVLPVHETPETFLAGVIFAIASNFVLIGSSKILYVIAVFTDAFIGLFFRGIGGLGWRTLEDKAIELNQKEKEELGIKEKERPWWRGPKPREAPPIEDIIKANSGSQGEKAQLAFWGALYGVGAGSKALRQATEKLDSFVGRDLFLATLAYVAFKFAHYKIFDPF